MHGLSTMSVSSLEPTPRSTAGDPDDRWAGCVSVIVPVYNEVAHVDELLRAIHASPVKKEIIIVDDGSSDGTRDKLQAMPLAEDVTVIFHEKNASGLDSSLRFTGRDAADRGLAQRRGGRVGGNKISGHENECSTRALA